MEPIKCIHNKRTLKRRIRRIVYLCIFVTILIFSVTVIWIGSAFFKDNTKMISTYFSSYIAQSMNSPEFLGKMGINSLTELKPENEKFQSWVADIKQISNTPGLTGNPVQAGKPGQQNVVPGSDGPSDFEVPVPEGLTHGMPPPGLPFAGQDFLKIEIDVNGKIIYIDNNKEGSGFLADVGEIADESFISGAVGQMVSAFDPGYATNITGADGKTVASVTVKLNDGYIIVIGMLFSAAILVAAIFALIAGLIISKIFTIPVTIPLNRLEEKIKAIATDSQDAAMTSKIELKKPLREIESLAESTNAIMHKMQEINELLIAQNEELEAQNEELFNSKKQVEEAQTLLVQTENMASIGQLTAAITHEINTPLGAIHSNAQIFDMLLGTLHKAEASGEDSELKGIVEQMKEANDVSLMACDRVTQIIRSLKNYSKMDQAEFQEADINDGLRSVLVLTSNLWKRKITMHEEYGELPLVKCFPGMLNQVFMNIVVNAVQAIDERGDIYIKTWIDGKSVYASIRDTGCGISEENLEKIFDNGYSTKPNGIGMGLGLAISRSIIDKHKGKILVTSKVGEGTEFTVVFPNLPEAPELQAESAVIKSGITGIQSGVVQIQPGPSRAPVVVVSTTAGDSAKDDPLEETAATEARKKTWYSN